MSDIFLETDEVLNNRQQLDSLIANHKSFQVVGVQNMNPVVNAIETAIEKQGMKVRVYAAYRRVAIGGIVIPTFLTQLVGLGTALFTAAHNAVTFNPDYEIAKNMPNGKVEVIYKK